MKIKFSYLMLILALVVSGCAAYFSVWGLSQLFAGASTAVIIMASALEIGKIITTTALHTYWKKLSRVLKFYLTLSVGILMIITSAGIYGFLSNAYQSTANKLEIHEGEVGVLEAKKQVFVETIDKNDKIIETKTKRVEQLNNLRTRQEARLDNSTSNRNQRNARGDIRSSDKQIVVLNKEIDELNVKNNILSDSVNTYNVKVIELKSGSEISGEIGPLKYISELTGAPMANIVNYMILLLIFVFDPLAIALILATNRIFELEGKQTPLEPKVGLPNEPVTITEVIQEKAKEDISEFIYPIDGAFPDAKMSMVNEETGEIDLSGEIKPIQQEIFFPEEEEAIMLDEQHDDEGLIVKEEIEETIEEINGETMLEEIVVEEDKEEIETTTVSEKDIEVPVKREPVIPTGKVNLEDIKEIKEGNRGFSIDIPKPKTSNTIERIGSNKIIKNGDNNTVFFKRK